MKKNQNIKTPVEISYRIQQAIEQMVSNVPKGTDLGLCDVISAMYSGYFVESGGGITPAVDQYLSQYLPNEEERAARSRRASGVRRAIWHHGCNRKSGATADGCVEDACLWRSETERSSKRDDKSVSQSGGVADREGYGDF